MLEIVIEIGTRVVPLRLELCRFFSIGLVEKSTLKWPCLFRADFNHDFKHRYS